MGDAKETHAAPGLAGLATSPEDGFRSPTASVERGVDRRTQRGRSGRDAV
jgi:hypothetical protein